jgi:hypothetical protein
MFPDHSRLEGNHHPSKINQRKRVSFRASAADDLGLSLRDEESLFA